MASNQIRLFKIASEINIGKDTIISFLQSKGFDVENKPTALLSDEMVEAVYDKFKRELKAVEKQREKVEKLKTGAKPVDSKPKPFAAKSNDQIADAGKSMDFNFIEEVSADIVEQNKSTKIHKTEVVIDLMEDLLVEVPPKKIESVKPVIEEIPVVEPIEPIKEVIEKPEIINEPKVVKEKIVIENTEVAKPQQQYYSKQQDTYKKSDLSHTLSTRQGHDRRFEHKEQDIMPPRKPAESSPAGNQESAEERARKKKKRRKIAEVELGPNDKSNLKGLRIVGKIDLEANPNRFKRDGDKPKTAETEDEKSKLNKLKKGKVKGKVKPVDVAKEKLIEKKKKRRKSIRESITEEDVERAIRETLSGMGDLSGSAMRQKLKQKKKAEREEKEQKLLEEKQKLDKELNITEFVTTSDLAGMMGVSANEIILKCLGLGLMVSINQRLDKDTITVIADDYGIEVHFIDEKAAQVLDDIEDEEDTYLEQRSPIVTIMGHVDHGKTSLLDFIREANVVAGEAGGITQHIGAYRVEVHPNKFITFLDTPGHEAFTAMRARGAMVTDIVVLVVAADDSVMPQTIEAISHAQAANVPIVVAINKIDKADANPDRIKQQLTDYNVLVEEWGGKNQSVEISAKKGINIDQLLEKILLEAEMLELKANPDRLAKGTIVEANMDKGLGPIATIIVQKGTLRIGDTFVTGTHWGKVRAMFDERMERVNVAGPSIPVRVIGFNGLPESGDLLYVVDEEYIAKEIANSRSQLKRQQEFKQTRMLTLDDISKQILVGSVKDLNLIIKADVGGSLEALCDSLVRLGSSEVRVNILHKGVGSINESDVMLAVASGAVIVGFQVNPTGSARKIADNNLVDIRLYNIIYDCINEIRLALEGLLTPDLKEEITSQIEVRKVYKVARMGSIAGCYILSGKITRNDKVRVLRDGLPIFTGGIHSLKRNRDDVREVETGYECGIVLEGFNNFDEGDIIESYKIIEVKRTL